MVKKTNTKQAIQDEEVMESIHEDNNTILIRKQPWSSQEDALVKRLVDKHGPQRWSYIAKFVPGRLGKQCRQRWHNHLNPSILKSEWMIHEEWILFLAHTAHGTKWAEMTRIIPGRTDNSIKNHWNSTMKKKIDEFMTILEEIIRNSNQGFLNKKATPDHFIKMEQELLSIIQNDKQNIIATKNYISYQPKIIQNQIQPPFTISTLHHKTDNPQDQTKSTEKYMMFSSLKKSERSFGIRQNLGTLIFETPPKGSNFSHYRPQANQFYFQKMEVSPTPLKFHLEHDEHMMGFLYGDQLPQIIEE